MLVGADGGTGNLSHAIMQVGETATPLQPWFGASRRDILPDGRSSSGDRASY